jgi:hypothetical protein
VAFCAAVDSDGNVITDSGGAWSSPENIDPGNFLTSVSCGSVSFCAAVDDDGNAFVYNGTSWTEDAAVDPQSLVSVSCTTTPTSFCTAVDGAFDAVDYNGSSWSAYYSIDENIPTSVSCPTATACVAVDDDGNALSWNGTSDSAAAWSLTADIDPGTYLDEVSCPTTSFCAAVDQDGNALIDNAAAPSVSVSEVSPNTGLTTAQTPVTITGSGFTPSSEVEFGGVPATGVTVNGAGTSITATSPTASAGTVDVIVTTSSGSSTPNPADRFTYTAPQTLTPQSCDPTCDLVASTPLNQTQVEATGSSTSDSAQLSLDVNTGALPCTAAYDYTTAVSTLSPSATGFAPGATLTVTDSVGDEPTTKTVKVCYAPGTDPTGTFLRRCTTRHPAPCLESLVEKNGAVVTTFSVPANEPRFWTGGAPVKLTTFSPKTGPPQTKLTIHGGNLTEVTAVVVGGTEAEILSQTNAKLVVRVPAGAITGLITVTAGSGVDTSTQNFTVT